MGKLTAGTAWVSITPALNEGYAMGGFTVGGGMIRTMLFPRRFTGVHDDIQARALVLSDGEKTLVMVTVDVIGLFHPDVLAIRELTAQKTRHPALHIMVSAVHTQSAPDTYGIYGGVPQRYRKLIYERASDAIVQALGRMVPVRVGFAMTKVEGVAGSRRDPQMVPDPDVAVMVVEGDNPVATLVNFACHVNIVGAQNTLLSADWPFFMREKIEKAQGGMALFVNGAVGDIHPNQLLEDPDGTKGKRTFAEAEKLGNTVANAVLAALPNAEYINEGTISITKNIIDVPVGNSLLKIIRLLGVIKRELYDGKARTEAWSVRLGPAQILTVPGQPFSTLGRQAKSAMTGKYRFLFGLTNDELAYIVPPEQWDPHRGEEGVSVGIETWPSIWPHLPAAS